MKRLLSMTLCLTLALSSLALAGTDTPETVAATTSGHSISSAAPTGDKTGTGEKSKYLEGQALVTLAVPAGEESDLLQKGPLAGDRKILVNRVLCFDDAEPLGRNKAERKSLHGKNIYIVHVKTAAYTTTQLKSFLKKYNYVLSVTRDYKIEKFSMPTDPLFNHQWYLGGQAYFPNGLGTTAASGSAVSGSSVSGSGSELSATPADDSYCVPAATIGFTPEEKQDLGDKTPVVAIVDDGVDYTHEDLKNMMWNNPFSKKKLPGKHGYDFFLDKDDPVPYEGDDHATHIAGYIAAESDNGIGMAGICKNVRIMSCKTFDGNNSSYDVDFAAFEYIYKAKKLGVNVVAVNCSFGNGPTEEEDPDMTEALVPYDIAANKLGSLGVITVFASGNSSDDFDAKKYGLPSQLKSPYIVKVGASTYAGEPAYFSNYGATSVDLFAPGDSLMSCAGDYNYIPESYTPEQRSEKCLYYNDFSGGSVDSVKTVTDLFPSKKTAVTLSCSDWDFVGDKKNGSLRVSLPYMRNIDSRAYNVYFDITGRSIDPKKQYRISFDYLEEADGTGDWSHLQREMNLSHSLDIFTRDDRTYLIINLRGLLNDVGAKIGSVLLFDNLSISAADPDEEQFGRYEYSGGTSFSAPIVVAAVARLRMLYPDDNAATIRAKLMASTRKLDGLTGKCICDGTLDMSKFESVADVKADPFTFKVEAITLNKSSAKLKAGKTLKLTAAIAPVYATNQAVSWSVSNSKWATVSNKGVVQAKSAGAGHTVKVTATAKDGSKVKAACTIKIV